MNNQEIQLASEFNEIQVLYESTRIITIRKKPSDMNFGVTIKHGIVTQTNKPELKLGTKVIMVNGIRVAKKVFSKRIIFYLIHFRQVAKVSSVFTIHVRVLQFKKVVKLLGYIPLLIFIVI